MLNTNTLYMYRSSYRYSVMVRKYTHIKYYSHLSNIRGRLNISVFASARIRESIQCGYITKYPQVWSYKVLIAFERRSIKNITTLNIFCCGLRQRIVKLIFLYKFPRIVYYLCCGDLLISQYYIGIILRSIQYT